MSLNFTLFGLDLYLFCAPSLIPPPSFPLEQLKQPALLANALVDFTIHADCHAVVVASTTSRRALAFGAHGKLVKPMSFFVRDTVFVLTMKKLLL